MNKQLGILVTALGLLAGTAQAKLAAVDPGPYTAASGYFPVWYQDAGVTAADGTTSPPTALDLCLSKAVSSRAPGTAAAPGYMCTLLPNPGIFDDQKPLVFPTNWPDESFWMLAETSFVDPSGIELIVYVAGLEAAFGGGVPLANDQVSFARIRIRASVPVAGDYTIIHPYGVERVRGVTGKKGINITRDIGIGAPGVFTGALDGDLGPFLQSVNGPYTETNPETTLPETFIGDPNLTEPVTGSPFGTNYIQILGPNGLATAQYNLFSLSGKLRAPAAPPPTPVTLARSTYSRTAERTWIEVFANSTPQASLCFRETLELVDGAPNPACLIDMAGDGNGRFFGNDLAPTTLPKALIVTATDTAAGTLPTPVSSPLTDVVKIANASYSWATRSLTIEASSSDELSPPQLVAAGFGRLSAAGGSTQRLVVSDLAQPPARVTVKSSAGGADSEPVVVADARPNPAPLAGNDSATATAGIAMQIDVLANDSDPEGDALTAVLVSQPDLGSASVSTDGGMVTYTPPATLEVQQTTSFTYQARDSQGALSAAATVTVTVNPAAANPPPTAVDDTATATAGGAQVSIAVLANDSDPEQQALSVVNLTPLSALGSATSDGTTVTYTPPASVSGSVEDTFSYQVRDSGGALSAAATIRVTVSPAAVNQGPNAVDDTASTTADRPVSINVLGNDSDPEGDTPLSAVIVSQPDQGSVSLAGTTGITYTPPQNGSFPLTTSFTYQAVDALGNASNVATVTVTVDPAIVETLVISSATVQARAGRNRWTISGTTDKPAGNTISIEVDSTGGRVPLGTVTPRANGAWSLRVDKSPIAPVQGGRAYATSSNGVTTELPLIVQ
ncbi:hypothetical protein SAMN05216229_102167 [Geopseudomonas sagittaria]|uniref:RapA2 cadherin-like domain-containing protein n=1 Tax=Geopseudomonas sagittaria TaxID=1135990 RepID=A0A1I5Q3A5_9GAMM|nr:Ig-like domain-containing protein [Pseudomonas sagittaria]SFP40677.1 hypothetical protein SAMN05216229_102167 [Pseudomonas sagittaria]